jgi:hypothetical protein
MIEQYAECAIRNRASNSARANARASALAALLLALILVFVMIAALLIHDGMKGDPDVAAAGRKHHSASTEELRARQEDRTDLLQAVTPTHAAAAQGRLDL